MKLKKLDRLALWFLIGLMLSGLLASAVFACDEEFIQEPTWREPVSIQLDWGVGFAFLTYSFIDGRKLVAIYRLAPVDTSEEPTSMDEHPLFYVAIDPNGQKIVYIDPEEQGACADIYRYEPITSGFPQPPR